MKTNLHGSWVGAAFGSGSNRRIGRRYSRSARTSGKGSCSRRCPPPTHARPPSTAFECATTAPRATTNYVAALLADIGEQPVPINDIATSSGDWESYQERVEHYVGPSGFMLFGLFDHGAWITKAGIDRKALRVILGNPLIAITMLRHDVTAGLFAPVEVLLTRRGRRSQ